MSETEATGKIEAKPVSPLQGADARPKPSRKAKRSKWAEFRARMRRRPQLRIGVDEAHLAIEMWREEKRLGRKDDPVTSMSSLAGLGLVLPHGAPSDRPRLEGDPIRLQVARFVEGEPGSLYRFAFEDWIRLELDDAWMCRLLEKRLPMTFLGPWDGLCEAEVDELDEEERQAQAQEEEARKGDGRLLPGMRRADG